MKTHENNLMNTFLNEFYVIIGPETMFVAGVEKTNVFRTGVVDAINKRHAEDLCMEAGLPVKAIKLNVEQRNMNLQALNVLFHKHIDAARKRYTE